MKVKTKSILAGISVGVFLVAGLFYWTISENTRWTSTKDSADASPPHVSAPTAPSASTPASPSTPPATAQPSQVTPSTAPAGPMATSPSAPPVTAQPSQVTPPTAPPASTAASPMTSMPAEARMSEADRRQVQEALHRLEYYQGPMDGIFGPLTRAAVRRFQHDIGAEATGYMTAEEANRLVRTR
jgi:type IV secretory pathway VirB10-like protein